jgi:hypothetical protein
VHRNCNRNSESADVEAPARQCLPAPIPHGHVHVSEGEYCPLAIIIGVVSSTSHLMSDIPDSWRRSFAAHIDSPKYASSLTLGGVELGITGGGRTSTSEVSETSWVHISRQNSQRPPPPEPIPVPSPAMRARGLSDPIVDPSTESDGYPSDRDLESGVRRRGVFANRRWGKGGFVDGFISGLKKLPKAVTKSHSIAERKMERSDMSSLVPVSLAAHSTLPDQSVAGSGFGTGGQVPLILREGFTSGKVGETSVSRPGETTTPHVLLSPAAGINSPVFVEPRPSSDYAKMDSPLPPPPPASLGHYISRVYQFLKDVNDLPWVSPRTTVDYIPGQSSRSRSQRTRVPGRSSTTFSWYAPPQHPSIDILSSGPSAIVRLPDSNETLVYPPEFISKTQGFSALAVEGGDIQSPSSSMFQQSSDIFSVTGAPYAAPQAGRHVLSRSLQIHAPMPAGQTAGNKDPDAITQPPPARTL